MAPFIRAILTPISKVISIKLSGVDSALIIEPLIDHRPVRAATNKRGLYIPRLVHQR